MGQPEWAEHTRRALDAAGYRASAPRSAVVEALAELGCSVTAHEINAHLSSRARPVGLASIYRALELLEEMALVQRVDVGEGVARYEPADPGGDHHHHLVCRRCGEVIAFEDEALERTMEGLSRRLAFEVSGHDVTLRGECPACVAGRA